MKKIFIILALYQLFCYSCSEKSDSDEKKIVSTTETYFFDKIETNKIFFEDGTTILQFFDENEKLEQEQRVVNDSMLILKKYYPNGNIKHISEWKNDVQDGNYKSYYSDGTIKQEGIFSNGTFDKFVKYYDRNGKLMRYETLKSGINYGCCGYSYREDGSLWRVGLHTFAGDLSFIALFNKEGKLESISGCNLTVMLNKDHFYQGETIIIEIDRYNIPNLEYENYLEIWGNGELIIKGEIEGKKLSMDMDKIGEYEFIFKTLYYKNENFPQSLIDSLNKNTYVHAKVIVE